MRMAAPVCPSVRRLVAGELLAVRVADLDAKDALLAIAPPGFFTIPHFNGYAAVLIALRQARTRDVRAAILDAFHAVASALPAKRPAARRGRGKVKRPARRARPRAPTRDRARAGTR